MKDKTMLPIRAVVVAIAAFVSFGAAATDAFDPVTNRLTMESVSVNGQNYKAVAVTLGAFSVLNVGSGAPAPDTFDPATSILTLGAVAYQGATYNNVQVRVSSYSILNFDGGSSHTGEQAIAYNLINAERNTCGFGLVNQNTSLDSAAAAHAAYLPVSSITGEDPHAEVSGRTGFTGTTPTARAMVNGYAGSVSEGISLGNGATAVRTLLSAPYHLRGLMDGYRDIGIGMAASSIPGLPYLVADEGTRTGAGLQLLGSNDVATYPCDGVTGVNFQLRNETPNPVPGRNLSTNPIGTPVFVKVRDGNVLQITSASMVNKATGAAVALRAPVGASNDPNTVNGIAYFRSSEAYVAPDAPLQSGTAYQVTIAGTNNGAAFSKTFSFTTGTGVN